MARRTLIDELFRLTTQIPWWLAAGLGGAFYYTFKYYLPTQVSENLKPAWTPMFNVLAWGLLGICIAGAITGLIRDLRDRRLFNRQSSLRSIRALPWDKFERFTLEAYRRQGFKAQATNAGADGGVDIVLTRNGETTLVQCKQWKSQRVGVKAIRELAGVVAARRADRGIFVCSGDYTADAVAFAHEANIELLDGKALEALLDREKVATEPLLAEPKSTHICPQCGGTLVRRVAKRGKHQGEAFLGCSSFPKCRYSRNF